MNKKLLPLIALMGFLVGCNADVVPEEDKKEEDPSGEVDPHGGDEGGEGQHGGGEEENPPEPGDAINLVDELSSSSSFAPGFDFTNGTNVDKLKEYLNRNSEGLVSSLSLNKVLAQTNEDPSGAKTYVTLGSSKADGSMSISFSKSIKYVIVTVASYSKYYNSEYHSYTSIAYFSYGSDTRQETLLPDEQQHNGEPKILSLGSEDKTFNSITIKSVNKDSSDATDNRVFVQKLEVYF